jgi:hypothetical protein
MIFRSQQIQKAADLRRAAREKNVTLYDYEQIATYLAQGWTIRDTAKEIGCSTWPVQCVKKRMKKAGFFG